MVSSPASDSSRVEQALQRNARVTLEIPLENATEVQQQVDSIAGDDWTIDAHLTVLHVGRLDDLRAEVAASTRTPDVRFVPAFQSLVDSWLSAQDLQLTADIADLITFQTNREWITALSLIPGDALLTYRNQARAAFLSFLDKLEVHDPEQFVATSDAIGQYSPNWNPHITISKSEYFEEPTPLDGDISVILGRPRVRPASLFDGCGA